MKKLIRILFMKKILQIVKQSKYLRVAQGKIEEELKKVNYKETCPIQKSYREEENDEQGRKDY